MVNAVVALAPSSSREEEVKGSSSCASSSSSSTPLVTKKMVLETLVVSTASLDKRTAKYYQIEDTHICIVFGETRNDVQARAVADWGKNVKLLKTFGLLQWLIEENVKQTLASASRKETEKEVAKHVEDEIILLLSRATSACPMCHAPLGFSPVRLTVCHRVDCQTRFEYSDFGDDSLLADIRTDPLVVDLLISCLHANVSGSGRGLNRECARLDGEHHKSEIGVPTTFVPYPTGLGGLIQEGKNVSTSTKNNKRNRRRKNRQMKQPVGNPAKGNIQLSPFHVREILNCIPPIKSMLDCKDDKDLASKLSPVAYELLRWIIRSCRAHIETVEESNKLSMMRTPHQFHIVSNIPERESSFLLSKKKSKPHKGSFYAFHGSPMCNWHSILRTGIRGGFVPGVYMAFNAGTSVGYCMKGTCTGWPNSTIETGRGITGLSILEVTESPPAPATIHVVQDALKVSTRFLLIYPLPGASPTVSIPSVSINHVSPGHTRHARIDDTLTLTEESQFYVTPPPPSVRWGQRVMRLTIVASLMGGAAYLGYTWMM